MNEKKLTAVEWLWEALFKSGFEDLVDVSGFYFEAKEMEKKQIIDAYTNGLINEPGYEDKAKKYYNETLKKQ